MPKLQSRVPVLSKPIPIVSALLALAAALLIQSCLLSGTSGKDSPPESGSNGYFKITAPTDGQQISMDSTYTILWSPSDSVVNDPVRIDLYSGSQFLANLVYSVSNSGHYSWMPSSAIPYSAYKLGAGMALRLKMMSAKDTTKWDFGPAFSLTSIYSGTITITSPTARSEAMLDSTFAIRWTSTGSIGTSLGIQLLKDTSLLETLPSATAGSGYALWDPVYSPKGSGDDYHIRVYSRNNPGISALSPAFSIRSSFTGGFTITYPAAGDVIDSKSGQYAKVKWSVTGNPGSSVSLSVLRDSVLVMALSSATTSADSTTWYPNSSLSTSSHYRIKMVSVSDPGIAALSKEFTIKGSDPDSFEVDDSMRVAKAITAGAPPQQRTLTYNDVDWAKFSASKGKKYLVSVRMGTSSSSASGSLTAYIMDSTGLTSRAYQSGANVQLMVSAAYTGNYFVKVSSSGSYGAYTLSLSEYDSTASPYNVQFTAPDAKTTWAAGSLYTIAYVPDSVFFGAYVSLALYNDSIFVQSIASDLSNSGRYSWTIPSALYTASKYRIRISDYNNSSVYSYSPNFTISGILPDTYEPDNTKSDAKVLSDDGVPQNRNVSSSDQDWIRINAVAGKKYLAIIASSIYLPSATLLDSSGSTAIYQSGSSGAYTFTASYTGPYYLRVYGSSSTYAYTATLLSGDALASGFPVKFTAPDTATTWAAGSSYTVNWKPDSSVFGTYVSLVLYLDSTYIQSLVSDVNNSGTYQIALPTGLLTSSNYRIRIASYNSSQIFGYSRKFTISGLTPDAYEPDDRQSSAKDILVTGVPQSHTMTTNDSDWVKFSVTEGKSYLLSVSGNVSVYAFVLDSLGTQVIYNSGSKFSLSFTASRTGKYYARIQYYSGYGAYTVSVNEVDPAKGTAPAKFLSPKDSTTWASGSAYTAAWTPDSAVYGSYVYLSLYLDTTLIQSFSSSYSNSGTGSISLPLGLATSNRYHLRMSSSNSSALYGYSPYFTIAGVAPDSLEPNDTAGAAAKITTNSGMVRLNLTNHDRDWFKFTGKAQQLYVIQAVSNSALSTTLRLYSGLGGSLLQTNSKTSSLDSVNSITWICPSDGQYSVSVDPYSTGYYGNYGFEIKEVDPAQYKFGVTAPAAASVTHLGMPLAIVWTDPSALKGQVDIFLYDAKGVVQTISANATNTGTYSWSVPTTLPAGDTYYVKIISRLSASVNGNSAVFSLAP